MTPTFRNENGYRFSVFSNEENRMHIHVFKESNTAKIWLEPTIEIAENKRFTEKELKKILLIVKENEEDFKAKFKAHIG